MVDDAVDGGVGDDGSPIPRLIVDEVGYNPFDSDAADLAFQLISSRCERSSIIVTWNKAFGRCSG